MNDSAVSRLWAKIRRQVDAEAGHLHRLYFPQDDAVPMTPNDSYLRVWLSELFLAKEVSWGAERSPAVQASVRLLFGGLARGRPRHGGRAARGRPRISEGRLHRKESRLTGFDYMVLRVEGRRERDDWRTPDLDQAIGEAAYAKALGRSEEYERLRADALRLIFFSPDLTPPQRGQLAQAVKEELATVEPGAAAAGELTAAAIVARRGLPSREATRHLTLGELLAP
jgi:hypothetical protein